MGNGNNYGLASLLLCLCFFGFFSAPAKAALKKYQFDVSSLQNNSKYYYIYLCTCMLYRVFLSNLNCHLALLHADSSEECKQVVPCQANCHSKWDVPWTYNLR